MPRYTHDCDDCKPLGEFGEYDLYYCAKGHPTVIARYGDDGSEYLSGMSFVGKVDELTEAHRRAAASGLLK